MAGNEYAIKEAVAAASEMISMKPAVEVFDGEEVVVALPARKLLDPVVEVIDGEEVVVLPAGKLPLSRELVDKILAIKRRPFSFDKDDIGSDDELRELAVEHEAFQDKFTACQAKIREHRHDGKGYAIVDDESQVRVAVAKALHPFVERYHSVGEEEDDDDDEMGDVGGAEEKADLR